MGKLESVQRASLQTSASAIEGEKLKAEEAIEA